MKSIIKISHFFLLFIFLSFFENSVFAQFPFNLPINTGKLKFIEPKVTGNCQHTGASVVSDPSKQFFALIFDGFNATSKGGLQVTNCTITIPIIPPLGKRIVINNVQYRGFANISSGGSGNLTTTVLMAGSQFALDNRSFPSGFSDLFEYLNGNKSKPGLCSVPNVLVMNTTLSSTSPSDNESKVILDTLDVSQKSVARFGYEFESCF